MEHHGKMINIREIPYNYTSFSDREIVLRFLGEEMWGVLNNLRAKRRTGRSARLLFEVLGDLWMVQRNPFIQDDLLDNPKRLRALLDTLNQRLDQIEERSESNPLVLRLAKQARTAVETFSDSFPRLKILRGDVERRLATITRPDNIDFSGMARVAHMTDATDWRVECPFVVITPDSEEEVTAIVQCCIELELTIIPRGGGTGYTGSGIPLHAETAIINTEKLNHIGPVDVQAIPGRKEPVGTIRVGTGAVTLSVAEIAERDGYIFAVDPTSRSASTIGGNIAMNAGGKKAVLWGTTLDNLLSWRMVTPDGTWLEVERLNHNMGKIHDLAVGMFRISHYEADGTTPRGITTTLSIPTEEIRKPGLGKDVTNKYLGGLPAIQKEGCDGLVTSAVFVVHQMPKQIRTVCLEFYGAELSLAVPAIVETKQFLDKHPDVGCAGLEHLDERYVQAVGYEVKSSKHNELPKMVLLADIVGDDEQAVDEASRHVVELAQSRNGEGFIAVTPEARKRFWADRSRTAAIAAHTNAFKINEDVVIPLEELAAYSEGIERINMEQAIKNKLAIIQDIRSYLSDEAFEKDLPQDLSSAPEHASITSDKRASALRILENTHSKWKTILGHLDDPVLMFKDILPAKALRKIQGEDEPLIRLLLRRDLQISYEQEVERSFKHIFAGEAWEKVRGSLEKIYERISSGLLFAALHMHAGDGNVHTNIPVFSNDYDMLQEADRMVHRIMALARKLGGEISGEHGIGMTKFQYLSEDKIKAFAEYKKNIDPKGRFNRGKLMPGSGGLANAYTPSLRLVQQEALILRESELGALNDMVRNCLRCGKCKPVCTTHIPQANLLYSPRNKILSTGLIIEAFLYEEQTKRGIAIHHFDEMNNVADHCTVCHKCVKPCPVDIDFGKVTMRQREILKSRGQQRKNLPSRMTLGFLSMTDPRSIRLARAGFIRTGYYAQRLAYKSARRFPGLDNDQFFQRSTNEPPTLRDQVVHFIRRPLPADRLPSKTSRASLNIEDRETIPIIRPLEQTQSQSLESVFYFPGCGCERLFSDISLATMALLRHIGVQTVLPPGYLCCGFPQGASGDNKKAREISTENRVLFHRLAATLNYLDIKTVIVSCGTCMTQLKGYQFDQIFSGSRLMDIHEFLYSKGIKQPEGTANENFLYHDPCHTPINHYDPIQVAGRAGGRGAAAPSGALYGSVAWGVNPALE
ncbi:MAG: DUF3683 domain-containing protein [Magnetococcales bacterium]|nr:DUF3683 domain-containing protein [Magnetococcales bacterium]